MTVSDRVYLDYNATAPLLPAALERMQAALAAWPGNPSSPHAFGQAARDALETARATLAGLAGYNRRELRFTSGGSESNTTLLRGLLELPDVARPADVHVIASPIEHPSVLRTCEWLVAQGAAVDYLPMTAAGVVEPAALDDLLRSETRLVTVMAANNETGALQPIAEIARRVRALQGERPVVVHSDAVQAFGRVPLALKDAGVDAVTLAAHKLGGPKGIGALVLREGLAWPPLVLGGRQERGSRAGTESVFLVEGFAAAAEWACTRLEANAARLAALRDRLVEHLRDEPGFFLNAAEAPRLPNTANLGFTGVSAQSLLVAADLAGVAVSTGSACSSGAVEPSHVLTAMGLPRERVEGALRISLGHASTEVDVYRCADVLRGEVRRLRLGRRAVS